MNCRKVSRLLSAYMDGELPGVEHRQIHEHLSWCGECAHEHERLLQMKRLLAGMRVQRPRADLSQSILVRLREEDGRLAPGGTGGWLRRVGQWFQVAGPAQQIVAFGAGVAVVGVILAGRMLTISHPSNGIHWYPRDPSQEAALPRAPQADPYANVTLPAAWTTNQTRPDPAFNTPWLTPFPMYRRQAHTSTVSFSTRPLH
ncbi:MAG TPA: zf-HC2 domain-containing protein [Chthonomonadaceae bacterium]|nr:zf-HC2 domain-containing protein [Chthonomonadaceae bacterium]